MGTRSLTVFKSERNNEEIVVMYRQYDGYPEGHGKDLAEFLNGMVVVNGFNSSDKPQANGMSCLAAQVVAHLKDGIGNIYLYPAGTRDCDEEYIYELYAKVNEEVHIKVIDVGWAENPNIELFDGTATELLAWIESQEES